MTIHYILPINIHYLYIFQISGEKPFRCLLKSCLKRFRYKGDLSKHIKKYHPGHTQELTPVPPQEDELLNVQHQASGGTTTTFKTLPSATATSIGSSTTTQHQQGSTTTTIVVSNTGSGSAISSISGSDNKFFLPLLPRHPVQQEGKQTVDKKHKQMALKKLVLYSEMGQKILKSPDQKNS